MVTKPEIKTFIKTKLTELNVLNRSGDLSGVGEKIAQYPNMGSIRLAISLYCAFTKFKCQSDLIKLCSIFMALSSTLSGSGQAIQGDRNEEGDIWDILQKFQWVLQDYQKQPNMVNWEQICQNHHISNYHQRVFQKAIVKQCDFEKHFQVKGAYIERDSSWEDIAKALLAGYPDQLFSLHEILQEKHKFVRIDPQFEFSQLASIGLYSQLNRDNRETPVGCFLAQDISCNLTQNIDGTFQRTNLTANMIGAIKLEWLDHIIMTEPLRVEYHIQEQQDACTQVPLDRDVQLNIGNSFIEVKGLMGKSFQLHKKIVNSFVTTETVEIQVGNQDLKEQLIQLCLVHKQLDEGKTIFWNEIKKAEKSFGLKCKFNHHQLEIEATGRRKSINELQSVLQNFEWWTRETLSMQPQYDYIKTERLIFNERGLSNEDQQKLQQQQRQIENRIRRVTSENQSFIENWKSVYGPLSTRETRMEFVAWVAVVKFGAKLEGGFVRDWIVNGKNGIQRPPNLLPNSWIVNNPTGPDELNQLLTPSDLDLQLPRDQFFDLDTFLTQLNKFGMRPSQKPEEQQWRYMFTFDVETGPFTVDLIKPHAVIAHDSIDFDVNNLYVVKGYENELGLRCKPRVKDINLQSIYKNITKKQLIVLKPLDSWIEMRLNQMELRGWKKLGENLDWTFNIQPGEQTQPRELKPDTQIYDELVQDFRSFGKLFQVYYVDNSFFSDIYNSHKPFILTMLHIDQQQKIQNDNAAQELAYNEKTLYHGTSEIGQNGILRQGFNQAYTSRGMYGGAMYFADDPNVSNLYSAQIGSQKRYIFVCQVALGNQYPIKEQAPLDSPPLKLPDGYSSGFVDKADNEKLSGQEFNQYLITRFGLAKPVYLIIYQEL